MYDLLIKNGTVVDGTGAAPFRADVAIAGGKVAAVGKVSDGAKRVIDASDLIVAIPHAFQQLRAELESDA